jgi:hypothetical protein
MRTDGGVTYNFLGVHPNTCGKYLRQCSWSLPEGIHFGSIINSFTSFTRI